jgi:hypothetical protein
LAVSEYTSPLEVATTTPPSGPTAGGLGTYCPGTWNRHRTTPGVASVVLELAVVTVAARTNQAHAKIAPARHVRLTLGVASIVSLLLDIGSST